MSIIEPYALFEKARKQCPNPFTLESVITANEVWGEVITNLPSLNEHIDRQISEAISEIKQKYSRKKGITIKGDRGTGKSHIIHRIWKKISQQGDSIFSYIGPCSNPKRINSHVRFYLADSFNHQDIKGVSQWQKLAAAAIKTLKGTDYEEKYRHYIEKCDSPNELKKYIINIQTKETLEVFFDELVEAILENSSNIDYSFLRAILFLLLKNLKDAQIAFAWIKGEEHSEFKKVHLPEFSLEQQEDKSIWMIQQICKLADIASLPVLICFDQLDSARTDSDSGDSPAETTAKCIDQIYFQCSNVILICCVISDTWIEIEQMGSGIPDRVGQSLVTAQPPNAEQMVELVKLRLNWFYKENHLNSNDYANLFPFEEAKIRNVASQAAGVRDLMKWCAEQFETAEIIPGQIIEKPHINPIEKNKKEFLDKYKELLKRIDVPIKDDDKLAAIITCNMKMIPAEGTANIVVTQVQQISYKNHDLHLIIIGYDCLDNRNVKIGVRVSEATNGNTFNAVMKRLLDYKKYGITRGCLVRSTSVPKNWKQGNQLKDQLENQQGGEVVVLTKEEMKPLVVIETIYNDAENYGFNKEEVTNLVKDLRLVADNKLICEILSAPN
ncbi:hypothetical protein [Calothrix sp. PCC 6303]|uniref:hypothetical protein n=1 Tax=Calothrix sp. PCC 6303 TaxID=1170562 RepID=UPI0002A00243|nr:hypothetical protein [Calothrix sp. PCC 6303]AFZ04399.1 hypothetical protein Cal6303_5518 [Calothrix sp. PCC 6303]